MTARNFSELKGRFCSSYILDMQLGFHFFSRRELQSIFSVLFSFKLSFYKRLLSLQFFMYIKVGKFFLFYIFYSAAWAL